MSPSGADLSQKGLPMTGEQPGADDGRPDGREHRPGSDLYRSGPPNREPLILSDKFVTPADAIVWLDPKTLQPLKVQPDMETAAVLARFDPCDEAEIVDDDWTPVSLSLWYSLPPDSAEFGVLIPGPFTVTHDDRTVENGMWLRWRAVEGDGIRVQYDTVSRLREWPLTAVTPTAAGIVLTKDDGGTAIVAPSRCPSRTCARQSRGGPPTLPRYGASRRCRRSGPRVARTSQPTKGELVGIDEDQRLTRPISGAKVAGRFVHRRD